MTKNSIIFLIIAITCIVAYLIYAYALFLFIRKKNIIKTIIKQANNENIDVSIIKSDKADYVMKTNNKTYYLKIVLIKDNIDLQINNIDTWYGYNGSEAKKIKTPISFIHDSSINNKIIILARHAKTIKKVINESEMIMVKDETDVYNMHILNYNQYSYLLKKD